MKKGRANDLGSDNMGPLLLRLAIPAILAQGVNALYHIIDRIYIGNMPACGGLALTGVGLCAAIIQLIGAFAGLVSQGGGSRAAIAMGAGDMEQANRILGSCTMFLVGIALTVSIAVRLWMTPLLYLLGASEKTIGYAVSYLSVYLVGTVPALITLGLNSFIAAQGFSVISMLTTVSGAVSNLLLDPLLIFGLDLGIRGASIATVVSQTVSAVWVLCFLTGKRSALRIRRKDLRLDWDIVKPVAALGVL